MDKHDSVKRLQRLGLPTPPSFHLERRTVDRARSFCRDNEDVRFWYLRTDRRDEGVFTKKVTSTDEVLDEILPAVASRPGIGITLQPRLEVARAGCLAVMRGCLYVEYIEGGLKALLRDGVTPSSATADVNGRTLQEARRFQEFAYQWDGCEQLKRSVPHPPSIRSQIKRQLVKAAAIFKKPAVLEWVEDEKGELYFLDMKDMPDGFLPELKGPDTVQEFPLKFGLPRRAGQEVEDSGLLLFERPEYCLLDEVVSSPSPVVFRTGGLLSHVVVYASQYGVPCVISERLYEHLSRTAQSTRSSAVINWAQLTNSNT